MQMTMNFDDELTAALREETRRHGRSLEETVIQLLRRSLRPAGKTKPKAKVVVDPEVLDGDWAWQSDDSGQLSFRVRGE